MTALNRRAGYTLVELMVVVTIVAVGAAAAVPGLISAMANRRASDATVDIVRLGRRARMEAIASGRAQVLVYQAAAPGMLSLNRGLNDGCNTQGWGPVFADANNSFLVEQVDLRDYSPGWGDRNHNVRLEVDGDNLGAVQICYQPDGAMLLRSGGAGRFTPTLANVSTGVLFHVRRYLGDGETGMVRQVVFPLGGTARVRR